jgi:nucleotide-binding universal stress UspA family protein
MYRSIVVGYDGSDQGRDSLALAALLRADDGTVTAACVYPDAGPGRGRQLEHVMLEAADATVVKARADVGAEAGWLETRSMPGHSPAHGLHHLAEKSGADLLVVGSSHHSGIGRTLAGSTGQRLLQGAPSPVTVAPNGFRDRASEPRVVGVAFDGSEEAGNALREGVGLAHSVGATVRLVCVVPPPDMFVGAFRYFPPDSVGEIAGYEREQFRRMLEEAAEPVPDELRGEAVLLEGRPADLIKAAGGSFDLLVMGSRAYGPIRRVLLGSTAAEVMRDAPCPVLVVPRGAVTPSAEAEHAEAARA